VNFGFASAVVFAVLGIAGGLAVGHRGSDASGTVRIVAGTVSTDAAPQRTVDGWLADIRQQLAIRPDQGAAWQKYADAMTGLDASRTDLERQLAGGVARDVPAERARHAMLLTTALTELEDHLSPEQQNSVRLLTRVLADTVICRELATR